MTLDIREVTKAYEAELAKKYHKYIELSYKKSKELSAAEDEIRELKREIYKLEDEKQELEVTIKTILAVAGVSQLAEERDLKS